MLTCVSQLLHKWKMIAEQLLSIPVGQQACQLLAGSVTGFNWLGPLQNTALLVNETG